ncbi:unnamed protein product [[Candida] boidinii]|uniref:Unnamed protein product n=1 Tax=Candida boidinii TaxID=5477 RepID=A0A9W6WIN1_CANBO|nr:hypothetical protein B5S33_g2704 [[Candida] boidinii]GME75657.1 unnamed protein product [[Candida] boidinii]GMG01916.1 unnamed protein product [[Candida] boidinii]
MSGNKRRLEEDDRINTSISDSFTDTQVDNRQLNIKKNQTISTSKSEIIKNFNNFIISSKNNSNNNDISSNLEFFKDSHRFIITKNDNIYDKLSSILKILNNKSSDCSIDNNEQTTDFLFLSMDSNSIQKLISIIEILKQKFNILNSNTGNENENGSENGNGINNGNNNKKLNFKNDKLSKNIYSYDKGNKDNDNININYYLRQFNYLDFTNVEKKSVNENNQEEDYGKLKLLNSDSNNKNGDKLIKKPIFYINLIFSSINSNFNSDFFNSKFKFLKENNWTLQYD